MKSFMNQENVLLMYFLSILFLSLTFSLLFVRPDSSLNTTRKGTRVMVRAGRRGRAEEEALDWTLFLDSLGLANRPMAY